MGMANLQRMAQQMQQEMLRVQNELEATIVEGSAGGGVVTATVTGKQVMDEWLAAAGALGAAAQAKSASVPDTDPELGLRILKARQAWISIVRAVLGVLDHVAAPADKVAALRKPVDEIEAKATMRAMARLKAGQPAVAGPTAPTG